MRPAYLMLSALFLLLSCNPRTDRLTVEEIFNIPSAKFGNIFTNENTTALSFIQSHNDSTDLMIVAQWEEDRLVGKTEVSRGTDWFINWADFPRIALFQSGKYIVNWLVKSSEGTYDYDIHVAIGDFGQKPDTSFILHDDGINAEHGFVSFAPLEEKMMAVWLDGRSMVASDEDKDHDGHGEGSMTLRSVIIDDSGHKTLKNEIDSRVCECCQTDLVSLDGMAYAVYRNRTQEEMRDNYLIRFDGHEWNQSRPSGELGWQIQGCPVNGPAIDIYENTICIAGYSEVNDDPKTTVTFWDKNLMEQTRLTKAVNNEGIGRLDIRMMNHETALLSWIEEDAKGGSIYLRTISKSGVLGKKTMVTEVGVGRSSGFPRMAKSADCVFMIMTNNEENPSIDLFKIKFEMK